MKIATVSLNFYSQNHKQSCEHAGDEVRKRGIDFAGFTEVRSSAMVEGLVAGLGPNYNLKGDFKESPIAQNRKKWQLLETHFKLAEHGEAKVTPNLFLVIAIYRNRKSGKVIEVISTHFVPLYDKGQKRPDYKHRWEMWRKHWDLLHDVVNDALALGHTVFVIGDFNNRGVAKSIIKQIHPKAKWLIRKGLDWVFYVEGDVKVTPAPITHDFSSGSDHKAHWRRVFLK